LGEFFHVLLFAKMLEDIDDPDKNYPFRLAEGLSIIGPVAEGNFWPKDKDKDRCKAKVSEQVFQDGAWEFRSKPRSTFKMDDHSDDIYKNTIEERDLGFCEGPFTSEAAVTEYFKSIDLEDPDRWIPLRRFGVPQKGKIRGVDDAAENDVNATSSRSEKLVISSVDTIVAMIRKWITVAAKEQGLDLGAWAMDEFKAYRQIPIEPDQRRMAVVAVVNPDKNKDTDRPEPKLEFFVMNGHCFGYTNAVYNYNRRPRALNEALVKEFKIATDFYYDDRWGIEPTKTIQSSFETVEAVSRMIGIMMQNEKAQGPPTIWNKDEEDQWTEIPNPNCKPGRAWKDPELLGVGFDLDGLQVKIKDGRRVDLRAEIEDILKRRTLSPGQAAKLKGRLFFLTCSLFGRIGRAFMRPLSERQFEFAPKTSRDWNKPHEINEAIEDALKSWLQILDKGRPRVIRQIRPGPADVVCFTDGFAPENKDELEKKPRVGAVMAAWWRKSPVGISKVVPENMIKTWIPRKNQIALIELFGAVLFVAHFGPEIAGKRIILLVDSESALDALIKGQSKFSDVIRLVKVFWEFVAEFHLDIYLDRVSTDANPSDGLSRGKIKDAKDLLWEIEEARFGERLERSRKKA